MFISDDAGCVETPSTAAEAVVAGPAGAVVAGDAGPGAIGPCDGAPVPGSSSPQPNAAAATSRPTAAPITRRRIIDTRPPPLQTARPVETWGTGACPRQPAGREYTIEQ